MTVEQIAPLAPAGGAFFVLTRVVSYVFLARGSFSKRNFGTRSKCSRSAVTSTR